jgi:hypothetical protein
MPKEACSIHGARLAQGAEKLPKYSERLAIKGSTRVALSAGKQVARTAVGVTTAVAAISVMGASSTLYLSSRNILRDIRLSESLRAKRETDDLLLLIVFVNLQTRKSCCVRLWR